MLQNIFLIDGIKLQNLLDMLGKKNVLCLLNSIQYTFLPLWLNLMVSNILLSINNISMINTFEFDND